MRFGDPSGDPLLDGLLPLFGGGDIALRGGLGLLLSLRGRPPLRGLLLKLLLGILIGLLLKLLLGMIGLLLGLLRIFLRGLLLKRLARLRLMLLLFSTAGLGLTLFRI